MNYPTFFDDENMLKIEIHEISRLGRIYIVCIDKEYILSSSFRKFKKNHVCDYF